MRSGKTDIEVLIQEGKTVRIHPEGYSMYPMFVPGRDEAVIGRAEPDKLRRGDVVLYRRASGMLVLHRLIRKDETGFYMVGDNQADIEGPLSADQIRGVLVAFVRNRKYISVTNPLYHAAARLWLRLLPVRRPILKGGAALKRIFVRK